MRGGFTKEFGFVILGVFTALLLAGCSGAGSGAATNANSKEARVGLYNSELQSLLSKGEGYSTVFTSGSRIVQFVGDGKILMDIPKQQLSGGVESKLLAVLGSKAQKGPYSIQASFSNPAEAADMVEKIFTEVYGLPADYTVKADTFR